MSSSPATPSPEAKPRSKFDHAFWMLNTIEMGERLAYYNLRVMAPIYIMQADNPGGLHLTAADKGRIYAWWAVFQSLLPIITGGLADRFGYKRTLAGAISLMAVGYFMIAFLRDLPALDAFATWVPATLNQLGLTSLAGWLNRPGNYWGFFAGILTLATGTAFFKPGIQGSLAQNLTKANSSVGWGIFYWVVNVGAFIGHFLPAAILALSAALPGPFCGEKNSLVAWRNVFLASGLFTLVNLALLLTYKDVPSGASKTESVLHVLGRTIANILDARLLAWLAIMSGFWMMMYQLWDTQPNFIADWVSSRPIAEGLTWLPKPLYEVLVEQTPRGPMIPQQVLLSANAFFIILGVIPAAWLTRKMRTLEAMLIGMFLATAGVLVAGWTQSAWILVLGILFFSMGEMTTGPKKNEYLGLIAPPGKKGLYLGYVNIPVGVGVYIGSMVSGYVYGRYGEKAVLALKHLAKLDAFGRGHQWDGQVATLETTLGITRMEAMEHLQTITSLDATAATKLLWDTYSPHVHVWVPFGVIGVLSAVALWIFGRMAKRWSDMNA